jgi:hypothetical protein
MLKGRYIVVEEIMNKPTDVNIIFSGAEPKISAELSQIDLTKALSWYSQNRDAKAALKYATDYFKKKLKVAVPAGIKSQPQTFGFVCRIVTNGGILVGKDKEWFEKTINELKGTVNVTNPTKVGNVISIQDHIKRKSSECIGELEGQLDEIILSDFKASPAPIAVMDSLQIKGAHTKYIVEHFKMRRAEYDTILTTDDSLIKEAYSNFTKPQLKKLIAYCDQVIVDGMKLAGEAVKTRRPRKRKTKTPEQILSKLQYCKEFTDLKLQSIDPKTILGATQLWVYNTKTRKLGCYISENASGFSVTGTSLTGHSETKSKQKTLRKPEAILPEIVKGGKVYLRTALDSIKAVESALSGRINTDTLLLRIIK